MAAVEGEPGAAVEHRLGEGEAGVVGVKKGMILPRKTYV